MNKEMIANKINHTAKEIVRTITTPRKLNLVEGEIYDNRGKAESWTEEGTFWVENDYGYTYVFYANNVPCHKVDYDNKEEVELLSAYEHENEVLVPSNTQLKIVSVATDYDAEEMGYYQIDLEYVGGIEND